MNQMTYLFLFFKISILEAQIREYALNTSVLVKSNVVLFTQQFK